MPAPDPAIVMKDGEMASVSNGSVTPIDLGEQNFSRADVQRFSENVYRKSAEVERQVAAGDLTPEDARPELVTYIEAETLELTGAPPPEDANPFLEEIIRSVLEQAGADTIRALVEGLGLYLYATAGQNQESQVPRTTLENTTAERTSQ